jgi:allantoin racemase
VRIANLVPSGYTEGFAPSAELAGVDVTVDYVEMGLPALPGNALDLALTELGAIEAAMRAEAQGYDALFINSVADYGLRAIRSAVRIPALGAGQASMLLACQLGYRFSIVSVLTPSLRECHEAQLREYGLVDQCASMRFVTTDAEMLTIAEPDSFYVRMRSRKADMVERISAQARAAVEDDGAQVIVLGCTCMVPVAPDVAEAVDVPVINPLDAVFVQAQALVQLGLCHSARAHLPAPVPRSETFSALVEQARATMDPPAVGQDCEPCAVVRAG